MARSRASSQATATAGTTRVASMQDTELDKIRAEISKLNAETDKLVAERIKFYVEGYKLTRETFWYPFGLAISVVVLIGGIVKLFL